MSIVFGLYQLLTNESFYYESDVKIWSVFKCMWGKIIKPEQKPKKHTVRGFWLTIIGTTAIILHVPGF